VEVRRAVRLVTSRSPIVDRNVAQVLTELTLSDVVGFDFIPWHAKE
jgi:hypothetical protein